MKNTACKLAFSAGFLLAHLSNMVCAVPSKRSPNQFENHQVVRQNTRRRLSTVDVHNEVVSTSSVSKPVGHRMLQNGTMDAVANDDDFANQAATTSTTTFPNATESDSTDGTDDTTSSASNETATEVVDSPTETPTLTVEDLISLMDDDSIQNATSFIPAEKEQPKGWAGEVIGFFILGAVVLFAATGIKQCKKRRTYSEVPTSLVV